MTTEFEFINVDVDMATLVFAENKLDKTPATQGCDPVTIADAQFSYAPWQYLNPSQGARETFMLEGGLSVAARPVGAPADPDLKPNPLTPVFPGNQYLLVPSIDGIHVAWADTLDSDSVALISPPPEVNPLTIAIDWHWGGILIGVTGCYEGMQVRQNAEQVGKRTTSAVVAAIFLVIVLDAFFAVFFVDLFADFLAAFLVFPAWNVVIYFAKMRKA